jgi:hypothetical protein
MGAIGELERVFGMQNFDQGSDRFGGMADIWPNVAEREALLDSGDMVHIAILQGTATARENIVMLSEIMIVISTLFLAMFFPLTFEGNPDDWDSDWGRLYTYSIMLAVYSSFGAFIVGWSLMFQSLYTPNSRTYLLYLCAVQNQAPDLRQCVSLIGFAAPACGLIASYGAFRNNIAQEQFTTGEFDSVFWGLVLIVAVALGRKFTSMIYANWMVTLGPLDIYEPSELKNAPNGIWTITESIAGGDQRRQVEQRLEDIHDLWVEIEKAKREEPAEDVPRKSRKSRDAAAGPPAGAFGF